MAQGKDAVTDIEKVKAEGLSTEDEVRTWALTHGYGPGMVDDFVAEWAGDAPAPAPAPVEEVKDELDLVEEELIAEEDDDDDYDDDDDDEDWDDEDDDDLWDDEDEDDK